MDLLTVRVLHGLTPSAGQPTALARALNRLPGIEARSLIVSESKFGFEADLKYPIANNDHLAMGRLLKEVAGDHDVFHLHVRGFYFDRKNASFPAGLDLLALKAAGKSVFLHFRGSEVRMMSEFRKRNPYHFVDENPDGMATKFPEAAQRQYVDLVSGIADGVFVVDPELQSYVPHATVIERAIDLRLWPYVGVADHDRPLIVHAPSRRGVKGTESVLAAIATLKAEGLDFEFQLVENLLHCQAREIYKRADIVVDQLRLGSHGVLAVEAWALGKAVVAYIRDDIHDYFGPQMPLLNATPDSLTDVLREAIKDKALRIEMGKRGRRYCERVHHDEVVARKLADIYRGAINKPRPVNLPVVVDHLSRQIDLNNRLLRRLSRGANGGILVRLRQAAGLFAQRAQVVVRMTREMGVVKTLNFIWSRVRSLFFVRF